MESSNISTSGDVGKPITDIPSQPLLCQLFALIKAHLTVGLRLAWGPVLVAEMRRYVRLLPYVLIATALTLVILYLLNTSTAGESPQLRVRSSRKKSICLNCSSIIA